MKFIPHGNAEVFIFNDILLVHATGPFNLEGVAAYSESLSILIGKQPRYFSKIVVLAGLALFTPDAEVLIVNEFRKLKGKGLTMIAVLIKEPTVAHIIMAQFSNIFIHAGIPYTFSNSLTDAERWLAIKRQDAHFSISEPATEILSNWLGLNSDIKRDV